MAMANGPQPINIWLESLVSSTISTLDEGARGAREAKEKAILVLLAKLALVYWRPDFTPSQAKQLYDQYLDDLQEYPFADISEACQKYRRDGENKFFPTPGQLRSIIETPPSWDVISQREHISNRRAAARQEMEKMVNHSKNVLRLSGEKL